MTGRVSRAKQDVLALVGGQAPEVVDWGLVAAMVDQHRLAPLLHFRLRKSGLKAPPELAARWAAAYRETATTALIQRAALRSMVELLERAGIAHVALKGSAVAWDVWPEPALRPMRDIDILVPRERLFEAAELLLANGFAWEDLGTVPARDVPLADKHLPPLIHTATGTAVEVHHALTDQRHARAGGLDPRDVLARAASAGDGSAIRHPDPADQFAHVAIHAVDVHRFDCGPLALADCHWLLARGGFDPVALAERAGREGWLRPAQLLCAMTAQWFAGTQVPAPFAADIPPDVRDAAEASILMDFDQRHLAELASSTAGGLSLAGLVRGLRAKASQSDSGGGGRSGVADRIGWVITRIVRLAHQLADSRVREEAASAARVRAWATGDAGESRD